MWVWGCLILALFFTGFPSSLSSHSPELHPPRGDTSSQKLAISGVTIPCPADWRAPPDPLRPGIPASLCLLWAPFRCLYIGSCCCYPVCHHFLWKVQLCIKYSLILVLMVAFSGPPQTFRILVVSRVFILWVQQPKELVFKETSYNFTFYWTERL